MLNTVGVIENTSDLSLPAVLGSAMIAFGLIPSLCLLFNDPPVYSIQFWPIIREISFYVTGLVVFLYAIDDGAISSTDSILLLSGTY